MRKLLSAMACATARRPDGPTARDMSNARLTIRRTCMGGECRLRCWSAPGRIRTSDQQLRRLLLYPPELRARDHVPRTHAANLMLLLASGNAAALFWTLQCTLKSLPCGYSPC